MGFELVLHIFSFTGTAETDSGAQLAKLDDDAENCYSHCTVVILAGFQFDSTVRYAQFINKILLRSMSAVNRLSLERS